MATATNKRTAGQQETPGAPSPKQRQLEQGRNVAEEDIPRLVDAFVKAQCRHKKAALEDTNEEVDTEEYDSDSSETTTPDEELSGKGIALYTVGDMCIIYIMSGDLYMVVTVVCVCVCVHTCYIFSSCPPPFPPIPSVHGLKKK